MRLFQWLAIPILVLLAMREIVAIARGRGRRRFRLLRMGVWLAAAAAIARPSLLSVVANGLGIGRGTDLVLYLFLLTFIATAFGLYAKCQRLERQLIDLARAVAIDRADLPPGVDDGSEASPIDGRTTVSR